MDDAAKRRREVANRIRVKASPLRFDRNTFEKNFIEPQIVVARDTCEATCQQMFCDACAVAHVSGAQLMRALHVTIEDDPLRNFWKLATLRCFGCGFEEIVSLDRPEFSQTAEKLVDVWQAERDRAEKEEKARQQQLWQQQHQMAARQAQMTQFSAADLQAAEIQQREQEIVRNLELKMRERGMGDVFRDLFKKI